MYESLFNLVNTYIFNGSVIDGSYEELVCILISSIGSIALVALPFFVVYSICSRIFKEF